MKTSTRNLAALGLAAVMALPAAAQAVAMDDNDFKVWKESVDEALKGINNDLTDFNKVRFEAFSNIRYDDVRNLTITPSTANTSAMGAYVRRAEGKFSGLLAPHVTYSIGFDFTDLKLKDLGIEVADLPLIPFVDSGQTWNMRLGQYRIPFGIVPQTSSSRTPLPDRQYIFGGAGQLGASRMVGERVMGLQGRYRPKLLGQNLDIQAGVLNNANQDADFRSNSLSAQYSNQRLDNDPSVVGRFAMRWNFIEGLLPERSRLITGVSYIRDSKNTAYLASLPASQLFDEIYGYEARLQLGRQIVVDAEWVRLLDIRGNTGLHNHREGWYTDLVVDVLPWILSEIEKGDKLELIFRLEGHQTHANNSVMPINRSRIGGGLKWSYWGGSNNTSVNYLVEGYNQNFGQAHTPNVANDHVGGPYTTLIVQQQFAFNNGKPRWMEKIEE